MYARPTGEDAARLATDPADFDEQVPRAAQPRAARVMPNRAQRRKLERDLKRAAKSPGKAREVLEKLKGAK